MNIIREDIDELNAVIKVKIVAGDYLPKVKSALRDYQKKATIPGFRPGKVPQGLIEKKYRTSLKADEISKLLSDSLSNYLKENNIDMIGKPLPKDNGKNIDWEKQEDFEFLYDMGIAPKFNVEISENDKMVFETLIIDDTLIDKNIAVIAKRYGKAQQKEISESDDLLYGEFVQLNNAGEIAEGGIFKTGSLYLDKIKDEPTKQLFTGRKQGDVIVVNSQLLTGKKSDLATILDIDESVAEILNCNIQFTIKEITHVAPADINQEFFDKIFGSGIINSEEEFRLRIKDELTSNYLRESDSKFYYDVVDYLMKKVNLNLPEEFLLRYLIYVSKDELSPMQVEADFGKYAAGMKWQLIENRIATDNNIGVTKEEMVRYVKNSILHEYGMQIMETMDDAELEKTANRVLENEEQGKQIYGELFGRKMKEFFKSKFTIENKEVDYDVFFNVKN